MASPSVNMYFTYSKFGRNEQKLSEHTAYLAVKAGKVLS